MKNRLRRCFALGAATMLISISAASPQALAAEAAYVHPALLNNQARLDDIKAKVNSTADSPIKAGYEAMIGERFADLRYPHQAYSTVIVAGSTSSPTETQFKEDAQAAYVHALRWVASGNQEHRHKAVAIMDEWSRTFQQMVSAVEGETWPQQWLEAAWYAPMWANAAEIIRGYNNGAAGWSATSQTRFSGFLDKLYVLAERAYRQNNWGASSGLALMAIGAYQNNQTRYAEGKRRILALIPLLIRHETGEVFELAGRDCWHPQYTLAAFTQAAEIADNQGDPSIFTFKGSGDTKPRLAMGLEYMAKSLVLGQGVRDCRAYTMRGYGEIGARWYASNNIRMPVFEQAVKNARPDLYWATFTSWGTATHGWGGF